MRTAPWFLLALSAACTGPAPSDVGDTDETDETDETDVPDLDASGWEVHPNAPQTYDATLAIEDQSAPVDFVAQGEISHTIVEFQGADFRNFIGEIVRNNPFGNTPPQLEFEMRVIVPEDDQSTGDISCRGPGLYGLTLALVAVQGNQTVPVRVFTTARLDPEDTSKPCTMKITKHTFQRFTATIAEAALLDSDVDGDQKEIRVEDLTIDVVLREKAQ